MKRTINHNNHLQSQGLFSQINQPQSVKILIFVHQTVFLKDYIFIQACTNLLRLDLSSNNINNFPKQFSLTGMHRLRVLLLHKNRFTKFNDLKVILECKGLQFLTLFGNPLIVEGVKIRHYVINHFSTLKLLDQNVVVEQQKSSYLFPNCEISSCSHETKLSFPIIDLSAMKSTSSYLQEINMERKIYTQCWLKCNPIIRIQRWWKMHLKKKQMGPQKNEKERIPLDLNKIAKNNQKHQISQQISEQFKQVIIMENNNDEIPPRFQNVVHVQQKKINYNQKIIGLFKINLVFWKQIIMILCKPGQIFLSKKTFGEIEHIQKISQYIKNQLKIVKNQKYKFVRNELMVKQNKRLLNYFLELNSKLIVSKISKKKRNNTQNMVVKFKQVSYQKRLNSHLTQQNWIKIKYSQNKLRVLNSSYEENVVILKGTPEKLEYIIKVLYKKKMKEPESSCCIFFEELIERVAAATMIQKTWRKYCAKRKLKLIKSIKEIRAANRIQKWMRNLPYYQRNKFLKYIMTDLKNQQNCKLYIHEKIYMNLMNIESHVNQSGYFLLPFQKNTIWYDKNNLIIESNRNILPQYFQTLIDLKNKIKLQKKQRGNIFNILHTGAKVRRWIIHNINFIQFQFHSIQQAKLRRTLLALKTFNFKHHYYVNSFSSYNYLCQKILKIKLEDLVTMSKVGEYITPQVDSIFILQPSNIHFLNNQNFKISSSQSKFITGVKTYYLDYIQAYWIIKQLQPQKQIPNIQHKENLAKITIQQFGNSSPDKQLIISTNISVSGKPSLRYQSLGQNSINKTPNNNISIQQNSEQKKFKILQSKIQKNQMKSFRLHRRNQLLQSIRLEKDRSNHKIKQFLTSRKQENHQELITRNRYIHEALNKRDSSFEEEFTSKGNFIMRQQFIHKVRLGKAIESSMQQKLIGQKLKKKREHTQTILLMKQRLKMHHQQQLREMEDPNEQLLIKQLMKKLDEDRSKAEQIQNKRKKNAKLRKIRQEMRKKIIHSVFPQQFYPLKGEQEWKLNLPKIQ